MVLSCSHVKSLVAENVEGFGCLEIAFVCLLLSCLTKSWKLPSETAAHECELSHNSCYFSQFASPFWDYPRSCWGLPGWKFERTMAWFVHAGLFYEVKSKLLYIQYHVLNTVSHIVGRCMHSYLTACGRPHNWPVQNFNCRVVHTEGQITGPFIHHICA